ncbi:hypothetical protein [Rheinheimera soli]|uniref:hypothetical protein n=1 Tax=Rheinheimera soli TaxID=443616 RepID=UPI001E4FC835|nr:hypothetical protein [Rheinheimera soli]
MSSSKALKKKISKRAKQKKNILVKNSIRLKQKAEEAQTENTETDATQVEAAEAPDSPQKNTSAAAE